MRLIVLMVICGSLLGCGSTTAAQPTAAGSSGRVVAPPSPREFRAAWVASVGNITWPSERDLSVEEQKKEMIEILDKAVALKLNAIIFQVRTQCDALYDSKLEPWSEYLTGTEGKAPEPYYDPLAMWVTEAHKRGLELHAWFNPYRAKAGGAKGERAANHVSKTKPQIVRQYGNQLWLDPNDPETMNHSIAVFLDVVKRYDIDGVHIDDYFFPYKVRERIEGDAPATTQTAAVKQATVFAAPAPTSPATTQRGRWRRGRGGAGATTQDSRPTRVVDFPDEATWKQYQLSGGKLSRDDWRRENVNKFIERLYREIKATKKHVKFGISPFGIWRPGNPPGVSGLDAHEQLYANSKLWLNKGWCDYFTPQLYWPIEGKQSFKALYGWWSQQNLMRRHLWPGSSVGRHSVDEVINQINITRGRGGPAPGAGAGFVYWSYNSLERREDLQEALLKGPYEQQALVPTSPWLDAAAPAKPQAAGRRNGDGSVTVSLSASEVEAPMWWSVQARYGTKWKFFVHPAGMSEITVPADAKLGAITNVVVGAVDRCGNESERVLVGLSAAP